jgi:hypothetical protein
LAKYRPQGPGGVRLADMEKHRNVWLLLTGSFVAVGCVFLSQALSAHGAFLRRPGGPEVLVFFVGAGVTFLFALRQVRVPFLRGSEAALLHRRLDRIRAEIEGLSEPDEADAHRVAEEARQALRKYSPRRLRSFESNVRRGEGQQAEFQLDYTRQGIEAIMASLEKGGET